MTSLHKDISRVPLGYSKGMYKGQLFGISKSEFNDGRSIKIFAESLSGNDFISLNYYVTSKGEILKPCEMPEQKVIDFLCKVDLVE